MHTHDYAGKFTVMLDYFIDAFPMHWPISVVADSVEEAIAEGLFEQSPILVARAQLGPELVTSTTMIYKPTGVSYTGAVYLMHPQGEGW